MFQAADDELSRLSSEALSTAKAWAASTCRQLLGSAHAAPLLNALYESLGGDGGGGGGGGGGASPRSMLPAAVPAALPASVSLPDVSMSVGEAEAYAKERCAMAATMGGSGGPSGSCSPRRAEAQRRLVAEASAAELGGGSVSGSLLKGDEGAAKTFGHALSEAVEARDRSIERAIAAFEADQVGWAVAVTVATRGVTWMFGRGACAVGCNALGARGGGAALRTRGGHGRPGGRA